MLRNLKPLLQYTVQAGDGEIGHVRDFYFHDDTWIVRYMVVDVGHWLTGRKVLVATSALGKPNWEAHAFPVALTQQQIRNSPEIDTDKPVSRQQEAELHQYYGWPYYWTEPGAGVWPPFAPPDWDPVTAPPPESKEMHEGDPHLRSALEVTGYHIHATDGELGHVKDFVADDSNWLIRYLVVGLGHLLPAKKVLISPEWLGEISYAQKRVDVGLTREAIVKCPEFHPTAAVNREYEERLYDYYGRPVYWAETGTASKRRG